MRQTADREKRDQEQLTTAMQRVEQEVRCLPCLVPCSCCTLSASAATWGVQLQVQARCGLWGAASAQQHATQGNSVRVAGKEAIRSRP
jgi:hypothetical protein